MFRRELYHLVMSEPVYRCACTKRLISRRQILITGGLGFVLAPAVDSRLTMSTAVAGPPTSIDFANYGKCDGVTDDKVPFASALSELASTGGGTLVLPPTAIAIKMDALPTFDIPANVKIVGTPRATKILLSSAHDNVYLAFAGNSGANVTFDGITIMRTANCVGMVFYPAACDGFHVRNCVIDGQTSMYPSSFHGWVLNRPGKKRNLTINGCTVTEVKFGLLQSNESTADSDNIVVDDCVFTRNYGDDLGFNAPRSNMTNVTVTNCRFTDNASTVHTSGYGVSFAHVSDVAVRDCYFENYTNEAIHVEDNSTNLVLSGNRLVNCGTADPAANANFKERGGIVVVYASKRVLITGNTLDHTDCEYALHGIVVKPIALGADTSPSGIVDVGPEGVTISDNVIRCGIKYQGIWVVLSTDVTVIRNRITGSGAVTSGAYDDGNVGSGIKIDGARINVSDNNVSGFRYGISGPIVNDKEGAWAARRALGLPGVVAGNVVTDCYVGLVAVSAGALAITGNILSNCVRPMVVGEGDQPAEPCLISGNWATDCTYPIEAAGKLILLRTPHATTVTVGTNKIIEVTDTLRKMPAGTVITFNGGGVLTLTKPVTAAQLYGRGSPYALIGNITGTDIGPTEYGITSALEHSTRAAPVFMLNNSDTISGP